MCLVLRATLYMEDFGAFFMVWVFVVGDMGCKLGKFLLHLCPYHPPFMAVHGRSTIDTQVKCV